MIWCHLHDFDGALPLNWASQLGGRAYAVAPAVPYALMAVFWLLARMLSGAIRLDRPVNEQEPPTLADVFAGVGFARSCG